ncbi:hypothetical protein PSECIP111951_02917 [Pseudoalteromonas holothuriae]|uniref:Uncharacterized protein n=1 Tax=Pseudoalteromonas holothuriae TaxID=2963714 RepID=A0A9W4QZI5_9GAMM|nr:MULTISPECIES: hypothetical protein [unclassified Pseudoalteromonas]CAH9060317.1 hypothetical protein PSECIP111854_02581 [Pseudoalteromonas sp. CIP111854]CAH9063508.1 hypothetical protein PSECIP111951_02917 [Pseudoalteromonas sp. CIP111951]
MAIISYTSLNNIKKLSINELPNTPTQIDEQLGNYNEMAHAFSPSPFDLIRLSMTQPLTSQYCAAYSLTAAAATLGILPENKEVQIQLQDGSQSKITLSHEDNFTSLALKLYKLTRFDAAEIKELLKVDCIPKEAEKGGSVPLRVAKVATSLGMNAELFVTKQAFDNFDSLAQKEIAELGSKASSQDVLAFVFGNSQEYTLTESPMPTPQADELNLVLIQTPVNTLHWVALSSDSTYFDSLRNFQPGGQFGCVGSQWSARPYVDTGVWITIKNKEKMQNELLKLNCKGLFTFD